MTRKLKAFLASIWIIPVGAMVVACSDAAPSTEPGSVSQNGDASELNSTPHYVNLPDGRKVLCVWESGFRKGGPSCDWANAK
ncbi:hypothetical protein J4U02_gp007 [Mycobacterium phage Aziz]|uniref:Lipoprotein n=1 Tax=Mycobacterium phage Aziz TaxID=2762281 RepID=A0A7G8LHE5_9CAUD|nr:hypothetical protein J4U02_gp007 [Mycobacterium phage Aziz]ASR75854.1 hypothetical protein SEA_GENEVAB15_7 [Mycobacterium phage GenevaB15]QNJ56667.1 hypothetical protein SEA_AZIZ_7 [Mycobacterium phage Aziz]